MLVCPPENGESVCLSGLSASEVVLSVLEMSVCVSVRLKTASLSVQIEGNRPPSQQIRVCLCCVSVCVSVRLKSTIQTA